MKYLILLFLVGCTTQSYKVTGVDKTLRVAELSKAITQEANPTNIHLFFDDESYTVFENMDYFKGILADYRKHSFDSGLRYSKKYDCEDFSRGMMHYFQVKYYRSHYKASAFALGVASYRTDEGYNHALCVAVIGDEVVFVEPQNGFIMNLSEREKRSLMQVVF